MRTPFNLHPHPHNLIVPHSSSDLLLFEQTMLHATILESSSAPRPKNIMQADMMDYTLTLYYLPFNFLPVIARAPSMRSTTLDRLWKYRAKSILKGERVTVYD